MVEILALIFFSKKNYNLAIIKNQNGTIWVWRTILSWIGFEFFGILILSNFCPITSIYTNHQNLLLYLICGLGSGYFGYVLIKQKLEKTSIE